MNKWRSVPLLVVLLAGGVARGEDWPQFRGPRRDNISRETGLLRKFPEDGPKVLWSVEACQGYAAAAIVGERVFFEDYNRDEKQWLLRCLNLADGKELWRVTDPKLIRPNHGITRTVPACDGKLVFVLDPKCVLHAVDVTSGKEVWRQDFVDTYKTQIPPWNNGQCPLLDGDRLIVAPGGAEALLVALDPATGRELWRTPNPDNWPMSHASVMPGELGGVRQYVYCTLMGLVGVDATDGKVLWRHARKFNVAVAPSPLPIAPDRVFMTSGYDAGTMMIRVRKDGDTFRTESLFELTAEQWNAEVHTPILFQDKLFAVGRKEKGLFTCLELDGRTVWTSGGQASFDLGSFLLADGMFFILDGRTGLLRLVAAETGGYRELDRAQVLSGDNVWGPMALSSRKLVLRDMTKMVCIDVAGP